MMSSTVVAIPNTPDVHKPEVVKRGDRTNAKCARYNNAIPSSRYNVLSSGDGKGAASIAGFAFPFFLAGASDRFANRSPV